MAHRFRKTFFVNFSIYLLARLRRGSSNEGLIHVTPPGLFHFTDIVKRRLGPHALESVNLYRLNAWISHQEDLHRIVFFVCSCNFKSSWNRLCLRQADCVLVLALGSCDPAPPSPIELALANHPTKASVPDVYYLLVVN